MQKAYEFDKKTVEKIIKGALLSFLGAGALGVLNFVGTIEINNPLLASFVVWVVPSLTNSLKEFIKGKN